VHALLLAIAIQAVGRPVLGEWSNEDGSVIVEIVPCGDAVCGTVKSASEKAQVDARRGGTEKLIGAEVLTNFLPVRADRWRGVLFVPDRNLRSKAELIQLDADRLRIRACAVGRIFCKSQVWQRSMR
jgi:uncharacterized protein (DUF2147 family)